jgi:hypothetical protein
MGKGKGEPKPKRAKTDGSKDGESILSTAWSHFTTYLLGAETEGEDDEGAEGEGEGSGDIDELMEIIELLSDSEWKEINFKTREGLIPVLLSVCHTAIAEHAVGGLMELQDEKNTGAYDSSNDGIVDKLSLSVSDHLNSAIAHFPDNAAAMIVAANYIRNSATGTSNKIEVVEVSVKAAELVSTLRAEGIALLEEEGVEEVTKEWIEGLLLDQVTGVHPLDDEEAEEFDEDGEAASDSDATTTWSASTVECTARSTAAMLYSMMNDHEKAKKQLLQFRQLTHRLHPNLWKKAMEANALKLPEGKPSSDDPVSFQDLSEMKGLLPEKLYKSLCHVFRPQSPYWQESDYAHRGYYSFFADAPTSSGGKAGSKPTNVIDDIVVNHLLPLARQRTNENIVGYEWWVHTRPIAHHLGHNLHFDTDEAHLLTEGEATHPVVSSVLYLTGSSSGGGSTIILEQTPDSETTANRAWVSAPKDNSLMVFPGNLLHGVLPCQGLPSHDSAEEEGKVSSKDNGKIDDVLRRVLKQATASYQSKKKDDLKNPPPNRLTFMVGFWTRRVPDGMKEQRLYGPCGKIPPTDDADNPATWVEDLCEGYGTGVSKKRQDDSSLASTSVKAISLPCVKPAWEELTAKPPAGAEADQAPLLEIPSELDHQFFVANAPHCFLERMFERGADQFEDDEDEGEGESDEDEDECEDEN